MSWQIFFPAIRMQTHFLQQGEKSQKTNSPRGIFFCTATSTRVQKVNWGKTVPISRTFGFKFACLNFSRKFCQKRLLEYSDLESSEFFFEDIAKKGTNSFCHLYVYTTSGWLCAKIFACQRFRQRYLLLFRQRHAADRIFFAPSSSGSPLRLFLHCCTRNIYGKRFFLPVCFFFSTRVSLSSPRFCHDYAKKLVFSRVSFFYSDTKKNAGFLQPTVQRPLFLHRESLNLHFDDLISDRR